MIFECCGYCANLAGVNGEQWQGALDRVGNDCCGDCAKPEAGELGLGRGRHNVVEECRHERACNRGSGGAGGMMALGAVGCWEISEVPFWTRQEIELVSQ